eukprot:128101-Ditylum_brightwellii.AAC.1
MFAYMDIAMGRQVAEELIFGAENVISGAISDIKHAMDIAHGMVTKYCFSDKVGIVYHRRNTSEESASSSTRAKIDEEVKKLTEKAYERALESKHEEDLPLALGVERCNTA